MKSKLLVLGLSLVLSSFCIAQSQPKKIKLAVIGLTHTHVHWILGRPDRGDVELVGIVEPNRELAERYMTQHGLSIDLVFESSEELLKAARPDGVCAFGTIYEHLEVVETFAPLGIHVMVEKPLAVSMKHAKRMAELARENNIHLLTNYETTWYPTNHKAKEILESGAIGDLRKVIVRDGHKGPKKIGVNSEFLDWLTDPVQNGGGAIVDFGCYGANLATWLMDGKKPLSVTAITQQLQPENNPKVEDEATIILAYPESQVIIQASWNWPIGRKDMEVYGLTGAIYADNRNDLRIRISEGYDGFDEEKIRLEERAAPYDDPFALFAATINGEIKIEDSGLSSLANNMTVVEILDAAKKSAESGKTVKLK